LLEYPIKLGTVHSSQCLNFYRDRIWIGRPVFALTFYSPHPDVLWFPSRVLLCVTRVLYYYSGQSEKLEHWRLYVCIGLLLRFSGIFTSILLYVLKCLSREIAWYLKIERKKKERKKERKEEMCSRFETSYLVVGYILLSCVVVSAIKVF
jgi:Na+-transporting methylmalonyl-CoA/oxaloacetate decarboxylase gamma subunit